MKKRNIKSILSLLLVLAAMLGFSATAYAAESGVTFEDGRIIAFEPGSVYTDTDLFDNFKGVMPGDIRTEEVTIQNNTADCDYIKVYMRAVLHDETGNPISEKVLTELQNDERRKSASAPEYMHDFLSQLSMKVWNGSNLIYEESPDKLDGLAENVFLGSIRKGETIKLNVELDVPIEMDNEYSSRIGEVDWVFVIEGFDDPVPPSEDYTKLTVRKVWVDDGTGRPDSVKVQLLRDDNVLEEIELNQNNQWVYTWDRLDEDYTWSVREADIPDGYEASYTTEGNTTTITNTEKDHSSDDSDDSDSPQPAGPVDLTVVKKWDDNGRNRPDYAKVTLYNGNTAVETVLLGAWNNWSYTWRSLNGSGSWQVIETSIPGGYTPSYSLSNGVVTVTNTAALIQTGQLSWPVPVLGGFGLLLLAYGFIVMTKKRKNERV
ncbi:MAG: Cna B-type domain-containing protein [Clostridiales bacterium]|nr:Cna B-type domain-containing protein [Clostridiales bacterium]